MNLLLLSTHFLPSSITPVIAESCQWFISAAKDRFPTFATKSGLSGHDAVADIEPTGHPLHIEV